jgi:hypothetical protein
VFAFNSGYLKFPDFGSLLEQVVSKIESLGPYGYVYFSLVGLSIFFLYIYHYLISVTSVPHIQMSYMY